METKVLRSISKAEELAHLHELYESDSYFRNTITLLDYNQMVSNIQNDHPLFLNTSWGIANSIYESRAKLEKETASKKFQITARKNTHPNGRPYLEFVVCDPYNEGKLLCVLQESKDGTDYVLSAGTKLLPIDEHCDIEGGMNRLHTWVANHAEEIQNILGHILFTAPDGHEEALEI